ncbi:hypothetical protein AYI69_g1802 [Smittium culicis]|uniref:Uncharacterized protein n=1 Tax=Smittium culicis TaxID=133412 RepID=A0A1R1YP87_9FUNG|nr:hypothetical protein AYI69_g1802 [Smittium culicis]
MLFGALSIAIGLIYGLPVASSKKDTFFDTVISCIIPSLVAPGNANKFIGIILHKLVRSEIKHARVNHFKPINAHFEQFF